MPLKKVSARINTLGPILIVLAATLWAVDGVIRRSLFHLPPATIVFYEHLIGSLLMLPWVVPVLRKEKLTSRVLLIASLVALMGGLLGTVFITTALIKVNFIDFSVVFLLQKLQPLFAIISAYVLLGEDITRRYLKWAGLALISAYFLTFPQGVNLATGAGTVEAALYAVGAAVAWGFSTTLSKMLLNHVSDQGGTILRFYLAAFFSFIAVHTLGVQDSLLTVGTTELSRFLYIAIFTGVTAMWLYYKGLKNTQAKISTILELAFPLIAVMIDALFYETVLQPIQYLAGLGLMFAIYQVGQLQRNLHKQPKMQRAQPIS